MRPKQTPLATVAEPSCVSHAANDQDGSGVTRVSVDRTLPSALPPELPCAASAQHPFAAGSLIGGTFRVERLLGRGGMGLVFAAHDLSLDRDVALKVLAPRLVGDPACGERFIAEARNMARVRSQHVVQVFACGREQGWPYIAMELVHGDTLAAWMHVNTPSPVEGAALIANVAIGLTDIHDAGMVHNDVKPANVMLGKRDRVVVTDLGLSRAMTAAGMLASATGSPRYMAPEQACGRWLPARLLARTDVYQLGVTAFEVLVGSVPFDGPTPAAVLERHAKAPPPRASSVRAGLGQAIDRVLLKALAKDPERRYESPMAFADELNAAAGAG